MSRIGSNGTARGPGRSEADRADSVTALDAARRYRALGCSVVPAIPGTKKPLVSWKAFQARRPDEGEIRAWYHARPDAGVIIVCGRVSGIAVVDIDPRNGGDLRLAGQFTGPLAETGSGGRHAYLAADVTIPKLPDILPGVDLQAEGSYVLAPPTIHPNGTPYRWVPGRALGDVPLSAVPAWLRQLIRQRERRRGFHRAGDMSERIQLPRDIRHVLSRLDAVRRSGPGWVARCPAHEDREPSLSIGIGREGNVLLHCFAGCAFVDIIAALGEVPA
jgi:hypothetical protein